MGLEDIAKDAKEEQEESEKENLKEDLGVDDIEELEELDDRLQKAVESSMAQDKKIEDLENDILIIKKSISTVIRDIRELQGKANIDPGDDRWKEDDDEEEEEEEKVRHRWE